MAENKLPNDVEKTIEQCRDKCPQSKLTDNLEAKMAENKLPNDVEKTIEQCRDKCPQSEQCKLRFTKTEPDDESDEIYYHLECGLKYEHGWYDEEDGFEPHIDYETCDVHIVLNDCGDMVFY